MAVVRATEDAMRDQPNNPLSEATFLIACCQDLLHTLQDLLHTLKDLCPNEQGGVALGHLVLIETALEQAEVHISSAQDDWRRGVQRAKCVSEVRLAAAAGGGA
jgi:hypothetical protein